MIKSPNISVLLIIFQPREIPAFLEATNKIKADKLWVKYYNLDDACKISRDYFLNYFRYSTHAAFVTDDIIFTQKDFDTLKEDVEKFDYDIISGWSNGNTTFGKDDSNLSMFLPPPVPHTAGYQDYRFMTISEVEQMGKKNPDPYLIVNHSGLMLTFLSRKVVNDIPFRTDAGCCRDAMFSNDLARNRMKQYIDLRVRLKHLKQDDTIWWPLEVGRKKPELVYQPASI